MRTFHIEVTQEDINQGQKSYANRCPIARAMERAGIERPVAGFNQLFGGKLRGDNGGFLMATPGWVTDWMLAFDRDAEVEPISFDITAEDGE